MYIVYMYMYVVLVVILLCVGLFVAIYCSSFLSPQKAIDLVKKATEADLERSTKRPSLSMNMPSTTSSMPSSVRN